MTGTRLESRTTYFINEHSTIWPNWPNDWAVFWVLICTVHLTVYSCHVTYKFESESTLYSCLNVKELLARSRREIWRLSDWNWTRTQNHLVCKRTKLTLVKWLNIRLWTLWCFILLFYHVIKTMGKRKTEVDTEENNIHTEENSRRKTKKCYHNDIYRWKKDTFSSEAEIRMGIIWMKILKKEFDWDKSPD